jgi:hypothetical protein
VRQLLNRARAAVRKRITGVAAIEPLLRWLAGGAGGAPGGGADRGDLRRLRGDDQAMRGHGNSGADGYRRGAGSSP